MLRLVEMQRGVEAARDLFLQEASRREKLAKRQRSRTIEGKLSDNDTEDITLEEFTSEDNVAKHYRIPRGNR